MALSPTSTDWNARSSVQTLLRSTADGPSHPNRPAQNLARRCQDLPKSWIADPPHLPSFRRPEMEPPARKRRMPICSPLLNTPLPLHDYKSLPNLCKPISNCAYQNLKRSRVRVWIEFSFWEFLGEKGREWSVDRAKWRAVFLCLNFFSIAFPFLFFFFLLFFFFYFSISDTIW